MDKGVFMTVTETLITHPTAKYSEILGIFKETSYEIYKHYRIISLHFG